MPNTRILILALEVLNIIKGFSISHSTAIPDRCIIDHEGHHYTAVFKEMTEEEYNNWLNN